MISDDLRGFMLRLATEASGQFPAGIKQLGCVRRCSFCQLLPREERPNTVCRLEVLNAIRLETYCSAAVSD